MKTQAQMAEYEQSLIDAIKSLGKAASAARVQNMEYEVAYINLYKRAINALRNYEPIPRKPMG